MSGELTELVAQLARAHGEDVYVVKVPSQEPPDLEKVVLVISTYTLGKDMYVLWRVEDGCLRSIIQSPVTHDMFVRQWLQQRNYQHVAPKVAGAELEGIWAR